MTFNLAELFTGRLLTYLDFYWMTFNLSELY